ncbi:MAG: hypothetical protein WCH62_05210 [Candidatus Omnitrophota bacterium]
MLNQGRTFEKEERGNFSQLNEDIYQFQLIDVNYEDSISQKSGENETKLSFTFVCLDSKDKDGNPARGKIMTKKFVPTALYVTQRDGKNMLYRVIEGLIGRELTQDEEAKGVSEKTINWLVEEKKQVRSLIENKAMANGKTYQNMVKFLPATNLVNILTAEEMSEVNEAIKKMNSKKDGSQPQANNNQSPVSRQESYTPAEEEDYLCPGKEINVEQIPFNLSPSKL